MFITILFRLLVFSSLLTKRDFLKRWGKRLYRQTKKDDRKGVTIRETGIGERLTPVFLSFTVTLFRLRGLEILLRFFCIRFQFLPFRKQ